MTPAEHATPTSTIGLIASDSLNVVRRHWVFTAIFSVSIVVRLIVSLAYWPAMLYPDSVDYLARAQHLSPGVWHPIGYSLYLSALHVVTTNLTFVTIGQHLMVLADGLLLYLLLNRFGVRPWISALGVAPVLLDAFQLDLEQYVLSESFFETVMTVAIVVLMWRRKPGVWQCGVVGVLLALTAVTRFNGIVLVIPAVLFVLIRRVGWKPILTMAITFLLPIVGYAAWYDSANGQLTVSGDSPIFLYGRIANFAECGNLTMPSYERAICPKRIPADRPGIQYYLSGVSPGRTLTSHDGKTPETILSEWDRTIIEHQPLDYINHITDDYMRQFQLGHTDPKSEYEGINYFQPGYPTIVNSGIAHPKRVIATYFGGPSPGANATLDRFLIQYQRFIYTPGPVMAICLLALLAAVLGLGRARRSGRRAECLVFFLAGFLIFYAAVATGTFLYRYQIPTLVFVPTGGALALAVLWPQCRSNRWEDPSHVSEVGHDGEGNGLNDAGANESEPTQPALSS